MGTGEDRNGCRMSPNVLKGAGWACSAGRDYICRALNSAGGCSHSGLEQLHYFRMFEPVS